MIRSDRDGLTRRGMMLGAARGLAMCPLIVVTDHGAHGAGGDAALVRTCRAFDALEHRAQVVGAAGGSVAEDLACERLLERIIARQEPLLRHITATRARTGQGLHAKAHSLALWDGEMLDTGPAPWDRLLLRSLVGDVLAMDSDRVDRMGSAC